MRNNNVDNKAALIIDDESDLASIDTYYGKKRKKLIIKERVQTIQIMCLHRLMRILGSF